METRDGSADVYVNVYKAVDSWFLMGSSIPLISIFIVYLIIVYIIGPRFMKNRDPYKLTLYTHCYNIAQIFACSWAVKASYEYGFSFSTFWKCLDDSFYNNTVEKMVEWKSFMWWFLWLRLAELSETVAYVLRKKQNQVTVLHVYHHISVAALIWTMIKFCNTFMIMNIAIVNSAVHVVTYVYYFLSGFKAISKVLNPVKPFITTLQLVQFLSFFGNCIAALWPSCGKSKLFYVHVVNTFILLALYGKFFVKNYLKEKQK